MEYKAFGELYKILDADQKRILLGDEETAVEWDFGPAAHGEKGVVERPVLGVGEGDGALQTSLPPILQRTGIGWGTPRDLLACRRNVGFE